ncbi:MAG TPA: hypothetical protein VFP61_08890 [Acidimicrobiales bacterium]|nr:hypothetical protein [Acidimicrobiales bacterium]
MEQTWAQRWLSRRALAFHALLAVIVPGCLIAGWWQLERATGGNTLSWAYTFEWPVFAIIATVGWWQLLHEDPADVVARKEERARRAREVGPPTPMPIPEPERLMLTTSTGPGLRAGPGSEAATEVEEGTVQTVEEAAAVLDSYNEYLATLAADGKAKTWRNPQGRP